MSASVFKLFFEIVNPHRFTNSKSSYHRFLHEPTYEHLELGIFVAESSAINEKAYPHFKMEEFNFSEVSDGSFDVYYKHDASRYDHAGLVLKTLSEKGKFAYCLNKFELLRYITSCRFVRFHYRNTGIVALSSASPIPIPDPYTEFDLGFIIPNQLYPTDPYPYSEQASERRYLRYFQNIQTKKSTSLKNL